MNNDKIEEKDKAMRSDNDEHFEVSGCDDVQFSVVMGNDKEEGVEEEENKTPVPPPPASESESIIGKLVFNNE